jgi:hypothetical protein
VTHKDSRCGFAAMSQGLFTVELARNAGKMEKSTSSTVVVDFLPCSSCNGILETMIPLAKIFA